MIVAEGLEKRFGERVAVAGLSLDVRAGEVFGLLGPNGAGKTTTVRMLTALIAPTAGRATVAGCRIGEDDDGVRQRVGVLTETPGLYARLTAAENLRFFGKLHGVDDLEARIGRYLALLGLGDRKDDKAGSFSKGMRQKLAIARALLHEPQVVFLDEPTSGLDPTAARVVRDFVAELRADGRAIVLCTHNLDEAERLCDRIAIVQRTILRMGTPAELRRALAGARLVVTLRAPSAAAREAASALLGPASVSGEGPEIAVVTEDPEGIAPDVVRAVVLAGGEVVRVEAARPSLEAVYFDLVGADGAREGAA